MASNIYTHSGFSMKATWTVRPTASGFAPGVVSNPGTKTITMQVNVPNGVPSARATITMSKSIRDMGCTNVTATCNGKPIGTQVISLSGSGSHTISLAFRFSVGTPKTTYKKRPASSQTQAVLRVGTIKATLSYEYSSGIGSIEGAPATSSHTKKRKKVAQGDTTYLYSSDENRTDVEEDTEARRSIITIYDAVKLGDLPEGDWADDWASNGLGILQPSECIVTEQAGGEYELSMTHPIDAAGRWTLLQNDRVIRCGVPMRQDPAAALQYLSDNLVIHDIHKVKKACNVYNKASGKKRKVLQKLKVGKEVTVLKSGAPMYVKTSSGTVGYMTSSSAYSTKVRTSEDWTGVNGEQYSANFNAHQIRNQCFRIYRVEVSTEAQTVQVNARHVSYDFATDLIGSLNFSKETGIRDALELMQQRLEVKDDREVRTDLDNNTVKVRGDFSLKNPINMLLDPNDGIVAQTQCQFVRDNYSMYLLKNNPVDRGYSISYGKNLLGLTWSYDTSEIVTRIVPTGQTEKGKTMYLPEGHVDSPLLNNYPFIRCKHLEVSDAKVGAQLKDEHGEVIDKKLSVNECYALMRERANAEYEKGIDKPVLDVSIDFVMLQTTEEYKEFAGLYQVFLYDTVHISHQPTGYSVDAQVKGYEWDAILQRYNKLQLGDIFSENHSTVAGYEISSGSISGTRIASSTISGANLQDLAITNAKIDYAAVETAQIADAAIDSAKIKQAAINDAHIGSLNADKITAGTVKTEYLKVTGDATLGGKSIIETMNDIAKQAVQDSDLSKQTVIGYVANDALTVTDKGMVLHSDGNLDIEAGGRFTIDSQNFKVNREGQALLHDVIVDGTVRSGGSPVVTERDIEFSLQTPIAQRFMWMRPNNYYRDPQITILHASTNDDIELPTIVQQDILPYCISLPFYADDGKNPWWYGTLKIKLRAQITGNDLPPLGTNVYLYANQANSPSDALTSIDPREFTNGGIVSVNIDFLEQPPVAQDGSIPIWFGCVMNGTGDPWYGKLKLYIVRGEYTLETTGRTLLGGGWYQCRPYVLVGDDPDVPVYDDDTPAPSSGGVDLIWSGSQTIASTFTFDADLAQYKFLILRFGSTYASTITLAVGGVAFGGVYTTSSNTSRMYFLMGTCAWTSNSLKMAWTFRFYKTSATAGGSSTLDPAIVEIYGIKG